MGLGNKLIVSATGFPGTNKTLRFIQDAFREPLGALAQLAGDKTIITGVVNTAGVVSNGFITYNGEIIPFQGGNYASTVTIIEAFENVNYNTDANDDTVLDSLPAYRTIYAMCGTGGIDIFNFSDLAPLKTIKELSNFSLPAGIVIDANYVHTDNNFTLSLLNKLNGISTGAEVNVQADWNVANPTSKSFIKNKPTDLLSYLYKGVAIVGDFPNDLTATTYINFPDIGTSNYMVLGTIHSFRPYGDAAQDLLSWFTAAHERTRFRLGAYEPFGGPQNIRFEYILIPLQL
ncbi:hypothetical protein [Flavobacterium columnare]|uniref:Uncharacterized protein n=1 Tax=Flavobacterium columnare TaxID=996 RepID=A0AAJ4DD87_9FLAO|nr:hypothetical protein [Flavobacterium columnare]AUX17341.1 hypothetical protein AQ623_02820 [Flavobacterium columnare]QCV57100.1 hypothetical protein UN65_14685 [Flavobacterium columnare]QOG56361.1 hypothetical protein HUE29_02760 [Flavobacterium columnare]QOG59085.1 hypothetical protein HUE30_02765 [Flavobacterium columnare]QOG61806.1 hypothetical protein HUE31_02765 [Flavobacterium columnare]